MPFRRRRKRIKPHIQRIEPPRVYFLTPNQTAAALGISGNTLRGWRSKWVRTGFQYGDGPQPVKLGEHTYRYRWDSVTLPQPGQDFLSRMKRDLWESIEAEKQPSTVRSSTPKPVRSTATVPT